MKKNSVWNTITRLASFDYKLNHSKFTNSWAPICSPFVCNWCIERIEPRLLIFIWVWACWNYTILRKCHKITINFVALQIFRGMSGKSKVELKPKWTHTYTYIYTHWILSTLLHSKLNRMYVYTRNRTHTHTHTTSKQINAFMHWFLESFRLKVEMVWASEWMCARARTFPHVHLCRM